MQADWQKCTQIDFRYCSLRPQIRVLTIIEYDDLLVICVHSTSHNRFDLRRLNGWMMKAFINSIHDEYDVKWMEWVRKRRKNAIFSYDGYWLSHQFTFNWSYPPRKWIVDKQLPMVSLNVCQAENNLCRNSCQTLKWRSPLFVPNCMLQTFFIKVFTIL